MVLPTQEWSSYANNILHTHQMMPQDLLANTFCVDRALNDIVSRRLVSLARKRPEIGRIRESSTVHYESSRAISVITFWSAKRETRVVTDRLDSHKLVVTSRM